MLAVFEKSVAKCPEELKSPHNHVAVSALKDSFLASSFRSTRPDSVTVSLGSTGYIAYSHGGQSPLLPRLFAAVDGIFCIFHGRMDNVPRLKQQYALNKAADEVIIIIEAYRTLRDRGPYPVNQVMRDFLGKFAFVLYDATSQVIFLATSVDGGVPFFWGTDLDGNLVLSDDAAVMRGGCGKSFAPFPKGCFFTSSGGLRSFEHPSNEVKPIPRVDSAGEFCGANFTVDRETKKETRCGMPRNGSFCNWSADL